MASFEEDTEMTDGPVREMLQLQIQECNDVLDLVGLADESRLQIGIDFGTKFSSICYDQSHSAIPLFDCEAPEEIIQDANGSHRFASVAAFIQEDDLATATPWQLDFGASAARNFDAIGQKSVVKINMMKLHLISGQSGANHEPRTTHLLSDLRHHHEDVMQAICNGRTEVSCRVQDPLSKKYTVCNIRSVDCIIREFLRYLLQSAKAHFARLHELESEAVETIFWKKADVAISVPTNAIWTDSIMDNFHILLQEAGFPRVTILAAGAHVAKKLAKQITVIADIGGGTTDITCLGSYHVDEDSCTISFGEIISGVGSLDGSETLNTLFKQYLRQQLPGGISQLVPGFQGSEDQILEAFAAGFEVVKRSYSNTERAYDIVPHFATHPELRVVDGNQLVLAAGIMKAIFDEWLEGIASMLQAFILNVTKDWKKTVPIVIGLTGWGCLPPYVLQFFNARFSPQGILVQMMETKTNPAVALGNYLQLVNLDLAHTQIAHDQHVARIGGDEAKMMADLRYSKHGPPTDVKVPPRGPDLDRDLKRALLAQIAKES